MKRVHTVSARAKRVMRPLTWIVVVTFVSFIIHAVMLGVSAFPGGYIADGRYLVPEHGKIIELTASQYWFSYWHGVATVAVFAITFLVVIVFYALGDMKDEDVT